MKRLLRFNPFRDQDQCSARNQPVENRDEEALRAATQTVNRQCAARLQALNQGLNSGSCRGKVRLPSRTCGMLYQLNQRCSNSSTGQGTGLNAWPAFVPNIEPPWRSHRANVRND